MRVARGRLAPSVLFTARCVCRNTHSFPAFELSLRRLAYHTLARTMLFERRAPTTTQPNHLAGDNPEHSDTSTVEFYVAKVGYQAYCEYQMQLLRDVDGEKEGEIEEGRGGGGREEEREREREAEMKTKGGRGRLHALHALDVRPFTTRPPEERGGGGEGHAGIGGRRGRS